MDEVWKYFEFKNEQFGDDWEVYSHKKYGDALEPEQVAENVSHYLYNQDPGDPYLVSDIVEVKNNEGNVQKFKVRTFVDVNFHANEMKDSQ